jgi:hypothetical protein
MFINIGQKIYKHWGFGGEKSKITKNTTRKLDFKFLQILTKKQITFYSSTVQNNFTGQKKAVQIAPLFLPNQKQT